MNLIQQLSRRVQRFTSGTITDQQARDIDPLGRGLRPGEQPEDKPSDQSMLRMEIGAGGVTYISGILDSDEFNAKLTGNEGVLTYDKMRRTDAQVRALINACALPLLGARWDIERPADEAEAAKISDEHIDFAKHNLFTRINFPAFLHHAVSNIWAGFSWFEKVYEMDGDQIVLSRLSPRLATTLWRWWTDGSGTLTGVQQKVWKDRAYRFLEYPRDKIALFVFDQEANSYEGTSLLRATYKHWYIKDALYKLDAIRCERFAVGVPNIVLPADYDDKLYRMAQEIGKAWKGAEQSYVISVEGMKIEIIQVEGGAALDLMKPMMHHNEEIAKVGLVQFINFGMTQTGSRALGESSSEFFYDAAEGWAHSLSSSICREVLWPLLDYNFEGKIRPVMVVKDLGAISLGQMTATLGTIGQIFVTPTMEVENAVRERLNLPLMTEEQWGEKKGAQKAAQEAARAFQQAQAVPTPAEQGPKTGAPKQQEEPQDVEKVQAASHDHGAERLTVGAYWRPLRPSEEFLNLGQIAGTLDDAKTRIVGILKEARDAWMQPVMEGIRKAWPDGPKEIVQVEIPATALTAPRRDLLRLQEKLFDFGQGEVMDEMQAQARRQGRRLATPRPKELFVRKKPLEVEEAADLVGERTEQLLVRLKTSTEQAAWQIAMGEWRTQGPDDISDADMETMMADIFDRAEADAGVIASASVSETLNLGRGFGFEAFADEIEYLEYSAILDANVCTNCAQLDGKRFAMGSADYYDLQPPLRSRRYGRCRGLSRCRCILVAVLTNETEVAS